MVDNIQINIKHDEILEQFTNVKNLWDFGNLLSTQLESMLGSKMYSETIGIVNSIINDNINAYMINNPDAEFLIISARINPKDPCILDILFGKYKHDCNQCMYVGTYFNKDMYICLMTGSLILRYGSWGHQYESLPIAAVLDCMKNGTYAEQDKIKRFIRVYEFYKSHYPEL